MHISNEQPSDDLGIARGIEMLSLGFQFSAKLHRVDQIAVMCDGDVSNDCLAEDRLSISRRVCAGRAVAGVTYGEVAGQGLEDFLVEDLTNEPEIFVHPHEATVANGESGTLLASVLQGEETKKGESSGFAVGGIESYDSALFFWMIEVVPFLAWHLPSMASLGGMG